MAGRFEPISVIGLGYIGLPTAAMLAGARRATCIGVDVRPDVVEPSTAGSIHIVEPDLDIVVSAASWRPASCAAATQPEPADAFVIAVPTPFDDDKSPTCALSRRALARDRAGAESRRPVVLESTSPVGTTERAADELRSRAARPQVPARVPQSAPTC